MDLKGKVRADVDWIYLAQDQVRYIGGRLWTQ